MCENKVGETMGIWSSYVMTDGEQKREDRKRICRKRMEVEEARLNASYHNLLELSATVQW